MKKVNVSELKEFDLAEHLTDEAAIAEYLNLVLEDGDASLLAAVLGDIARAKGMTQIALDSGVTRESLYRALSSNATPRFDTITKVLSALGVRLAVVPA